MSMTALEGKVLLDHGRTIARRYAKRIGPELADELRAEAMLRALGSPPPDGRMEPWLERIYRNLFVDRWRRGRIPTVDLDDLSQLGGQGTPEEDLLRRERRRVVRVSLNQLPRDARRALLSRYYGALDDEIAAARLGIAPVTIRTRIHRALARLRVRLADLRAWCPPILGKLGTQAAAVGLTPVMVAALIVASTSSPSPAPALQAPPAAVAALQQPQAHLRARAQSEATAVPSPAHVPVQAAKKHIRAAVTAAQTPETTAVLEVVDDEPIVGKILHPDIIDVFAEPERRTGPCMVEAPPSFQAQIEKTIEELL
jgi:RNA polymerase sigma-70 factor (ECF subfamily)